MIDSDGFRPNVGIILVNTRGQLLWARRVKGQNAWQFPQGGISENESPEQALYRELYEEVGLAKEQVSIIASTRGWLRYRLPKHFLRKQSKPLCIGQKQKWFLLQYHGDDAAICLDKTKDVEFDAWCWVSYWYPVDKVIAFKRDVYRRALKELAPAYGRLQDQIFMGESSC